MVVNDTEIPITDEVTLSFSYNDDGTVNVEIVDKYSRAVNNVTVLITFNGITYNLTTNTNGIAILTPADPPAGEYSVDIKIENKTLSKSSQNTIKIIPSDNLSSIIAEDMKRAYNSGYDFKAMLLDKNANPLKNMEIIFVINGNDYLITTDEYGYAYLKNTLSPGTYNITIENPATNEKLTKNTLIVDRITNNNDLTLSYSFTKTYKIFIYADNGERAFSGENVVININGKSNTLKTASDGSVSYVISDLAPKTYTITATYKNVSVSNKVVVKQVLKASNKNFKRYASKKYTATLKTYSGKAIKNKKSNIQNWWKNIHC